MSSYKNNSFIKILILLVTLLIVSVAGYMLISELPFIEALYMTIITISTVGYGEVAEMDLPSKIFTIFIIFAGLGIVAYSFTNIAAFLVEGDFRRILKKRSMERRIERMKNHFIVCGAGQTGASVIEQFKKTQEPFVIIEQDKAKCEELTQDGYTVVNGDAAGRCDDAGTGEIG